MNNGRTTSEDSPSPPRPALFPLVLVGAAAGLLSGLFGIGGGTIIVPALVLWLGMPQKLAAGSSVFAILPAAVIGALTYSIHGNVDWIAALCLGAGIIVGAQLGSRLLTALPVGAIQWAFIVFLLVVIVSLWFVVPQRADRIELSLFTALLLVLVGLVTGVCSGVLGVGGGIVVVPTLMFFFGANDLQAKGTSLLMMIPGSISGTIANLRRRNTDLRVGLVVGLVACVFVPLGALFAGLMDPLWANAAFSVYLSVIVIQMVVRKLRSR